MIDVEKLKQKILDLAIRGKLVPQDPNDEPASVLINKIKAEKAKLVKEGKIKPSKEESYIYKGSDNFYYEKKGNKITRINDIPFDIPVSWSWVRLSDICSKIVDGDHNPPKGSDVKTDFIMLSATNINDDKICDLNKVRYITKDEYKTQNERTKIQNGDILLTIVGTMGRSCVYSGEPNNVCFQRSVAVLTTLINNNYLKIVFDSKYIQDYMQFNAIGTAQKGFYLNQLANLLIPVPPLNEQNRISKNIDTFKSKISTIFVNLTDIESLVAETKSKILDTIFNSNSSYKSYYKKTEGKLIDFCSSITKGSTPTTYGFNYQSTGISFIKVENVHNGRIDHSSINQFISEEAHIFQKRSQLKENDILYSIAGTIGKTCIIQKQDLPANTNQAFAIISGYEKYMDSNYLFLFLQFIAGQSGVEAHGGGMDNATLGGLKKLNIWFPSFKEDQMNIVKDVTHKLELLKTIMN